MCFLFSILNEILDNLALNRFLLEISQDVVETYNIEVELNHIYLG
jgi:hypothetical protein